MLSPFGDGIFFGVKFINVDLWILIIFMEIPFSWQLKEKY